MARRTAISFRSVEIEAELDRRYPSKHQGAKRDLLDYYAVVDIALKTYPQRLVGARYVYLGWLERQEGVDWGGPPFFAYNVACARLREAHPGVPPFDLTAEEYEAAGFRIL